MLLTTAERTSRRAADGLPTELEGLGDADTRYH